jgi:hypothetical protein
MNPRGINENDLCVRNGLNPGYAVSGGLRFRRYNGNLFAKNGIQQRRFTNIRPANE